MNWRTVADQITLNFPDMRAMLTEMALLPQVVRQRIAKGAVASAASVIRKAAIDLAPEWTGDVGAGHPPPGTLKRAIYQARLVDQCTPTVEVWAVDVRAGKQFRHMGSVSGSAGPTQGINRDAFYARWVEYGHYTRTPGMTSAQHRRARSGVDLYTGATWVAARPFMRPAFESNKDEAIRVMEDYIRTNLAAATAANRFLRAA